MKINFKQLLPHLAAILAFLILVFVYNSPLLEGKRMRMEDMTQVNGMSKELQDFHEKTGEISLWTNSLFGGMPAYQIYMQTPQVWVQYPHNLLAYGLPQPASLMLLYLLGGYFLFAVLGFRPLLSVFGAIAFAFSSYNLIILDAGHLTKAMAIGYMPVVLAGLIKLYKKPGLSGLSILSIGLALQVHAYHYQVTYYLAIMVVLYVVFKAVEAARQKTMPAFLKSSFLALFAAIISIAANFTSFYVTYEYTKETLRNGSTLTKGATGESNGGGLDREYALRWSYGIGETGTLIIPNFYGGASVSPIGEKSETFEVLTRGGVPRNQAKQFVEAAPTYFGDQPSTAGPTYFGASIVFLFVLALLVVDGTAKWWLLSAAIMSFALMWGRNFSVLTDFFFDYMPMYNKFRAVSIAQVTASLAFPFLAVILIQRLLDGKIEKQRLEKNLKIAAGVVGGFCLLFVLAPGAFFSFDSPADPSFNNFPGLVDALKADRAAMLRSDSIKSLILVLIAAAAIWFWMKDRLKPQQLIWVLLLSTAFDLWLTDKRYVNSDDFVNKRQAEQPFEATAADLQILQDTTLYYRVFDLGNRNPFNENRASYFHKSVGGYHAAKLARFEDLKNTLLQNGEPNMNVLNMLNTRWFILPAESGPQAQMNPTAFGNAWFANDLIRVKNADEAIDTLDGADLRRYAIVEDDMSAAIEGFTPGTADSATYIVLTEYAPNKLTYKSNSPTEQLAVFSEIYYDKGWKATIDGQEAPHFRADFLLRAMRVPAGEHTITFSFEPNSYQLGETVSMASSAVLALLLLGAILQGIRKKKEDVSAA